MHIKHAYTDVYILYMHMHTVDMYVCVCASVKSEIKVRKAINKAEKTRKTRLQKCDMWLCVCVCVHILCTFPFVCVFVSLSVSGGQQLN